LSKERDRKERDRIRNIAPDGSGPRSAAGRVMNVETVEGEYVPGPDGYLR
jgi:hypothetical protein